MERFNGWAAVAIAGVIVILENQGARSLGPSQEFEPARERHSDAGWILIRRRNVQQLDGLGQALQFVHSNSVLVDGNRSDSSARGEGHGPGRAAVRIFESHAVATINKNADGKVEALFGPRHDQYFPGM